MSDFITIISVMLFLVSLIACGVLYFLLRRSLDRNIVLEEENKLLQTDNETAYTANATLTAWFEELKGRIVYAYGRIKTIDASGHFEADDEVGYFFKELKELIERLHQLGIMDEAEKEEVFANSPTKGRPPTEEELQRVLARRNARITSKEE